MSSAIERVEASWAELMAAIEGIDNGRMSVSGVAGDWTVKDVLAHIAYWESRAIRIVNRVMNNEPAPTDGGQDFEEINQLVYAERANWSVAAMLDDLHSTHERFMMTLQQYPQTDPDEIEGNTFEHYDEHAADIRAWREQAGI